MASNDDDKGLAHPPETWKDFVTHYCVLIAGVGGLATSGYCVKMLTLNPEIWIQRGTQLMQRELSGAQRPAVPLAIAAVTGAKIGIDFLLLWRGTVFVSRGSVGLGQVELFRGLTHGGGRTSGGRLLPAEGIRP